MFKAPQTIQILQVVCQSCQSPPITLKVTRYSLLRWLAKETDVRNAELRIVNRELQSNTDALTTYSIVYAAVSRNTIVRVA